MAYGREPMDLSFPPPDNRPWAAADRDRWDDERLAAGLREVAAANSASVVILDRGRLLAEGHWTDDGPDHREEVASIQKSMVCLLVGVARERGLLDLDDPVVAHLGPGWSKATAAQERAITLRHLLTMTSGLDPHLAFEAEPGTRWFYNTPAYHLLKPVLAHVTGRPYEDVTADWLSGPIGMAESRWEAREPLDVSGARPALVDGLRSQGWAPDPDGRLAHRMPDGSLVTGMVSTARDLARFALLVQARGAWDDAQVIPGAWIDEATRPSQALNPAYGYLFWCNGHAGLDAAGRPIECLQPGGPADLVAARGAQQRSADCSRSLGIALSRVGGPAGNGMGDLHGVSATLWRVVIEAQRG